MSETLKFLNQMLPHVRHSPFATAMLRSEVEART